ncbi:MAG TPA: DUF91 domain-containing protein [Thermoanaerobaculia bacterium]
MDREERLESIVHHDASILGLDVMIIGRQVPTDNGKRIDLLAVDGEGALVVVELKRDRTPRDVVAQLLDYGSWVKGLGRDDIGRIWSEQSDVAFEEGFRERFGALPETLNESHSLVVVASELDPSTERIVKYLSESGIPINAVFFRCFHDDGREYLTRSWFVEPHEAEARAEKAVTRRTEPWNGQDFYVSIGDGEHRTWEDCVTYGFVAGGQGKWYSQTLQHLFVGARVFAYIPERGYVGVGIVQEPVTRVRDFRVEVNGKIIPVLEASLRATNMGDNADDPEKSEYVVRVHWLKTLPMDQAIREKGLFAKQHTACKLRHKFTLDRLTERFGLEA